MNLSIRRNINIDKLDLIASGIRCLQPRLCFEQIAFQFATKVHFIQRNVTFSIRKFTVCVFALKNFLCVKCVKVRDLVAYGGKVDDPFSQLIPYDERTCQARVSSLASV